MLSVRLFGGLAIDWGENSLPVIPNKVARSLFAYLLVQPDTVHTRDLLTGMFWPELPEAVARRRLSQALWHIRNVLREIDSQDPPNVIVTDADTLQINPDFPLWVDVNDFVQHLTQTARGDDITLKHDEAGLALYEGEFLKGYYEDWVVIKREQLRLLLLDALARLVEGNKRIGDYERALIYAREWTQEEPWYEPAHREIMHLCHLLERDTEALRQFETCRTLLADEIDAEPAPETVALAQEIARQSQCNQVIDLPQMPPPVALIFDRDHATKLPLVGREAERTALLTPVEALMQGIGGFVLVEGEAGVGKTRLLQALICDAEWRSVEVLWGTNREIAQPMPYAALIEALGAKLTALRVNQLKQLVEAIWIQVLKPLIPPLAALLPDLPLPLQLDAAYEKRRLAAAFSYLLIGWSQITPLLLVIEDLHWASADMLDLLAQVLPILKAHRILIVGSYRGTEARAQSSVWQHLQTLDRAGAQTRLVLNGLDVEATSELIQRGLGLSGSATLFETRLFQETQGNPLFVLETLRALHSEGLLTQDDSGNWNTPWDETTENYAELPLPRALERTITRRLRFLSPLQEHVLHLAAVLGDHVDFGILCVVCADSAQLLLTTLRELVHYRFLDELERDYGFSHDKVRQVVYTTMDERTRQTLHHQVAQAFESLYLDRVSVLAYHWTCAEVWDQSAIYHQRAGDKARAAYANTEAIMHYTQALQALGHLPDTVAQQCVLVLEREAIYDLIGDREAQARDLELLARLVTSQGDTELKARVCLRQTIYHHAVGDYSHALAAVQEAVHQAQMAHDVQLQAESHRQWGRILWHQGKFDDAYPKLETALELALRDALHTIAAHCFCDLGAITGQQGKYPQARAYFLKALHINRELGNRQDEGMVLNNLGIVARRQGHYDQARTYHEQSLDIRRKVGNQRGESSALNSLGIVCRHQGDYAAAKQYFEQALTIMHLIGDRWFECRTRYNLGACLMNLGDYSGAKVQFEHSLRISQDIGDRSSEGTAFEGLAMTHYHQGEYHAAYAQIQKAVDIVKEVDEDSYEASTFTTLGTVLTALDQPHEAAQAYQRAIDVRCRTGQFHYAIEPQAGLVRINLAAGNLAQALAYVNDILVHLENQLPAGVEEPFRIYLTCYQVLQANADSRASSILHTAYHLLQDRADRIGDVVWRRSYLENLAVHRDLVNAYNALYVAQHGKQIRVELPRADVPPGRPLRENDYVTVTWTLESPDDAAIQRKIARRHHRLLRLLREAQSQNAIPRDEDLANALDVGLSTLRRDVAALRTAGHTLPPRRRKVKL